MTAQPARAISETDAALPGRRERRLVTLVACGTREDGSLVDMTVVDLSYDGCGVICSANLVAGERLDLSVLRRGGTRVTVRWVDGARAGLSFAPDAPDEQPTRQARTHERVSVEGEVMMRRAGRLNFQVHIYDLSPDGCKAEFVERPELNEQLWIKFDRLEAIEAKVCWIVGVKAGLRFARSIHPAVFDLLVRRLSGETR
jgi:PilZ domain